MELTMIKVILDTDIGDDIDDTWAVAYLLSRPDVEIVHVGATTGETSYKAKILDRLFAIAKKESATISVGIYHTDGVHPQEDWVKGWNQKHKFSTYEEGMKNALEKYPDAKILLLGPSNDFSAFARKHLDLVSSHSICYMAGAVKKGYINESAPGAESNLVRSIDASNWLFDHLEDITLIPLDVCRDIIIDGGLYQRLCEGCSPLGQAVLENYRVWDASYVGGALKYDEKSSSSILYDVAVPYALLYPERFEFATGRIEATNDGKTVFREGQGKHKVALNLHDLETLKEEVIECLA